MTAYDVVIVGTGHGGAQLAIGLRQMGFAGSIALVGEEDDPPYERPPLSKEYLSGERTFERLLIRPRSFWADRAIDLHLGRRIVEVDPARRCIVVEDGARLAYRTLVWAAGGVPRRLSCAGHDLAGLHHIRTRSDVDGLTAGLPAIGQVVVVGGGYIGLEAAAALIKAGKRVTLVEATDRLLARVAGPELSHFIAAEHRARGVEVLLGTNVSCIEGADAVAGVRLHDGRLLPADAVIVGIGIEPAIAPLAAAGARVANGVAVDALCRTSLPDVYAIGDCALHANRFAGGAEIRLESVQNANDQAMTVARAITGNPMPYDATPWFWSNQYDLRLQTVGLSTGHDQTVLRGAMADRSFAILYLRGGRVIALDCVNATRDYVAGRRLVEGGKVIDPLLLADTGVPLKQLI